MKILADIVRTIPEPLPSPSISRMEGCHEYEMTWDVVSDHGSCRLVLFVNPGTDDDDIEAKARFRYNERRDNLNDDDIVVEGTIFLWDYCANATDGRAMNSALMGFIVRCATIENGGSGGLSHCPY